MFKKILIANRAEIACRVIKTARAMGIQTVAVYSDADKNALHVSMADEAVHIGPAPAVESYLLADRIIAACKETQAEAVHPGYGFLSENADFARALEAAGICFIGPKIRAIEVMGDKIASKKFANKAKVPTVPGHLGVIKDADEALKIAKQIGFPVMIKASAGGGGKGMRVAENESQVAEGFALATSEAKTSFGDDRVFIEKFISQPRHIEIQVLADAYGNVIHLGERECSIQRRHQKVLEEAPSPFLDDKTRKEMGEQAVALARAVDYESVGTVEFIVDKNHNFYFLEMNTRLQVEHPVTELVTGVDLVEQMLRVAAGEKLSLQQKDIKLDGWAIESRIYAEDPYRNFLPSTGRLVRYQPPEEGRNAEGLTIRNDTGVYEGGEIPIYYDPMIAKLCTHGPTREAAIDHMSQALDGFLIEGIRHNIPFLAAVMNHERWRAGDLSTDFIAKEYPDGFRGGQADSAMTDRLIAVAGWLHVILQTREHQISGQFHDAPRPVRPDWVVMSGDQAYTIIVEVLTDYACRVVIQDEGGDDRADIAVSSGWRPGQKVWQGMIDGAPVTLQVNYQTGLYRLMHRGISCAIRVATPQVAALAHHMPVKDELTSVKALLCPMPGLVVSLHVEEGQEVKAGDVLVIVEAMKMENMLRAERDGIIASIKVRPGDSLAVDETILEFK